MSFSKLSLIVLPYKFAIYHLDKNDFIPPDILQDSFFSITKTDEELSIVCLESSIPQNIKCEKDWRAFKVQGPLDFALTGILSSLAYPLAQANISIFAISTFDTDYILVKQDKLEEAIKILQTLCYIE